MYSYWSFIDKIQTCGSGVDVSSAMGNLMVANIVMFNTLRDVNEELELDFKHDLLKAMYCNDLEKFFSLKGITSKLDEDKLQNEINKILEYKRKESKDDKALYRLLEDIDEIVGDDIDKEELIRAVSRGFKKAIREKERKND